MRLDNGGLPGSWLVQLNKATWGERTDGPVRALATAVTKYVKLRKRAASQRLLNHLKVPPVEESVLNLGKFLTLVRLVAFAPFKSAQSALENINAVSEGEDHTASVARSQSSVANQIMEGGRPTELIQEEGWASCPSWTQAILEASRSSMGMDISPIDLINIERFSSRVISLSEYRKGLQEYLRSKMSQVAPSLSALIGEVVGARLISHAGSLTNLAKYPASTVQILGAEKALFRALKTRGNTPKYGLIFHSTFIGRAAAKNKGRISRYLANKCTIASRIDCFSEVPTSVFGDKLREQVEERLAFYETGEPPRKNLDVMKEAVVEATEVAAEIKKKLEKREKKKRKREKKRLEALAAAAEDSVQETTAEANETEPKKKKKRKRQEEAELEAEPEPAENGLEPEVVPKKKKKLQPPPAVETPEKKKKKKNKKAHLEQDSDDTD
ncbi:PREDICTED: nucleolar protein 56 [Gekko japonicus]|uniref:Nucleolar protein 56 n=1 Tax=Gekko japonicus TaxID=146911 RepID=A0ABM1KNI1_GEKJA|nr:PREDICTED: nucleolar protein 56 [Gekko japonicus]